jgi:hypothetical protein
MPVNSLPFQPARFQAGHQVPGSFRFVAHAVKISRVEHDANILFSLSRSAVCP